MLVQNEEFMVISYQITQFQNFQNFDSSLKDIIIKNSDEVKYEMI